MVVAAIVAWGRIVFIGPSGNELATCAVASARRPDLALVDALARAQLVARRSGGRIYLRDAAPELWELLEFVGLDGEMGRQPERGEEVGVEERVVGGDPAT